MEAMMGTMTGDDDGGRYLGRMTGDDDWGR